MGALRLITIYLLIIFNVLTALYMEAHMTTWWSLEILILLTGLLGSLIVMVALAVEAEWAWPLTIVYFSAAVANDVFLISTAHRYLAFLAAVTLNLIGFVISLLSANKCCDDEEEPVWEHKEETPPVETYDVQPHSVVYDEKPAKKRGRKKKIQ